MTITYLICFSILEKRETFGYKKRFPSSAFMQDKPSTLIGQLIKETMDKRNFSYRPLSLFYPSLTVKKTLY